MELGEASVRSVGPRGIRDINKLRAFIIYIYLGDLFAGEKMLDLYIEHVQTFPFAPFLFELIKTRLLQKQSCSYN